MLAGLKKAPATFQGAVDIVLSRVRSKTALVYQNGVVLYSKTVTKPVTHFREARQLLQTVKVTLKLAKCTLFDTAVS